MQLTINMQLPHLTGPGPNIRLNVPIIQIIIFHLLFKKMLSDKMQMKHEYHHNTFWPTSAGFHENFLFRPDQ